MLCDLLVSWSGPHGARIGYARGSGGCLSGRMPGQAVGAVGDVNAWQLGVEQQLPGRAELGDVGYGTPANEQVAVAGGLRVPLFCGQQALGLPGRLHQGGHLGRQIQPDGDHPAIGKQPGAAAGFVVEQRVLVIPDGLGVVLVGEDLARLVEDLPGRGLEHRTCCACRRAPR